MKLFFQRSIILLLLLLQGVSPFVHAHVMGDGGELGLHIDGFRGQFDYAYQTPSFKSIDHADVVIGMQAAVQQKNQSLNDIAVFNENMKALIPSFSLDEQRIKFISHHFLSNSRIDTSSIAPRAPPIKIHS